MTLRQSLVIVNYRSWQHTRAAVESARESAGDRLEVVVVDNTCDPAEADELRLIPDVTLLISPENSGYAGGLNQGIAVATGELLFLSNPDIRFERDSLTALADAVTDRTIAGPRFTWDEGGEWNLPPADDMGLLQKLDELAAEHLVSWRRARDRRRMRERVNFWREGRPHSSKMLSGALLAMRRTTFDSVGGFDSGYALYFEEVDFFRRARLRGFQLQHVPAARCRHLYNQSAAKEPSSGSKFARSEARLRERWEDSVLLRLKPRVPWPVKYPLHPRGATIVAPVNGVVELTPLADFSAAAGRFASGPIVLPNDVLTSWGGGELYCRAIDLDSSSVVGTWRVEGSLQ